MPHTPETDAVVAQLLEQLGAVTDLAEACSIVLERAATQCELTSALVAVRGERGLVGTGWGIDPRYTHSILRTAEEHGSAIVDAIANL